MWKMDIRVRGGQLGGCYNGTVDKFQDPKPR